MRKKYILFLGLMIFSMIFGATISYFFINETEVMSSELDNDIAQKAPEKVLTTENEDNYKQILIGMWHAHPGVGAGYGDLYSFYDDGTFEFQYSQFDGEKRIVDISGEWEIIHDHLLSLTIHEKSIKEGGEFTQNVASAATDYVLENSIIKKVHLETPEEIIYPLKDLKTSEEMMKMLTIKIGGKQYWKLGSQYTDSELSQEAFQEFKLNKVKEFKDAVHLAEEKGTNYNRVVASIKGTVFDSVDVDEETNQWIREKRAMLNDQLKSFSVIYSGTSNNLVQFIALVQPQMSNSFNYTEAVNGIRGDENEMTFLNDIGFSEMPKNYYAIDLYVEDLLNDIDDIEIDHIKLKVDNEYLSPITDIESDELESLLSQYNRQFKSSFDMVNQSWNLYLFDDQYLVPDEIIIEIEGEAVKLRR